MWEIQDNTLESIQGYNNIWKFLQRSLIGNCWITYKSKTPLHWQLSFLFSKILRSLAKHFAYTNTNGAVGNETCSHTDIKKRHLLLESSNILNFPRLTAVTLTFYFLISLKHDVGRVVPLAGAEHCADGGNGAGEQPAARRVLCERLFSWT